MAYAINREQIRKHKRLKVQFGEEEPVRVAFTGDASAGGIHIITGQPERVGTSLQLRITLPDEQLVVAQGRVRWAKKIPSHLVRLSKSAGMGVKITGFESGQQAYENYLESLRL